MVEFCLVLCALCFVLLCLAHSKSQLLHKISLSILACRVSKQVLCHVNRGNKQKSWSQFCFNEKGDMPDRSKRRSLGVFNVDEHALEHFEFSFSETLTSQQPVRSYYTLPAFLMILPQLTFSYLQAAALP